jgi:hypothetical protein
VAYQRWASESSSVVLALVVGRPPGADPLRGPPFGACCTAPQTTATRKGIQMAKAKTTLRGRFSPGTVVSLHEVEDASVLRVDAGSEPVTTETVNKDGEVTFHLEEGQRYIAAAYDRGFPREVRLTGRSSDEMAAVEQQPVQADRVRLSDGSWADEEPARVKKDDMPALEAAPDLSQQQVPKGTPQRSDTPRGTAHPFDPEEPAPYESQENVDDDVKQMSDTELGAAARIAVGPQRQEDVPAGVWQRSHTPTGVATPIPGGGPVAAQEAKESSLAKEMRGEPGRAAAEPLRTAAGGGGGQVSNMPAALTQPGPGRIEGTTTEPNRTGLDAQGQPLYPDVAKANALVPGKAPAEAQRGEPKDVKIAKKDETAEVSGAAAKQEAVPEPTEVRRSKPPKGDMANEQTADPNQRTEPAKASGKPQRK